MEDYAKVRYGLSLKIDIYDYLNQNFTIKAKKGMMIYKGKLYKLNDVYTEFEERTQLIKEILIKLYGSENLVNRGKTKNNNN